MLVPFNKIYYDNSLFLILKDCISSSNISSDGKYTVLCEDWLCKYFKKKTILTSSCTDAIEMAALLLNINVGDEIIMPSYTFVSTASAFVLRGAVPVFVDINENTLNIDENLIEQAITEKTRAIVVVHYAGISCNMDAILLIARKYNLYVIEDAAHSFGAKYKNNYLGTLGDIGCFSFHETKNITSGEGGAIVINHDITEMADIVSQKGTNRKQFISGSVQKYTWLNLGSSYKMSDINAAILYSQLLIYQKIMKKRLEIWNKYLDFFTTFQKQGYIRCPIINEDCTHNAHIFYILFNDRKIRNKYIEYMRKSGVDVKSHYVPLHSSPAGLRYCRSSSLMKNTDNVSETIVRFPIFYDLTEQHIEHIMRLTDCFFE